MASFYVQPLDRRETGEHDIYTATVSSTGQWATQVLIARRQQEPLLGVLLPTTNGFVAEYEWDRPAGGSSRETKVIAVS